MELYTLSSKFLPQESVGQFTSAIWTERYFSAGDLQLVVQAVPSQIDKLSKGTLVGLRGTKEIMMIETQSVEDGLLTVTGTSLLEFLNARQAWFWNPEYNPAEPTGALAAEYTKDNLTAGQIISDAVDKMVINPAFYTGAWDKINLDWPKEKIPGLRLGIVDGNGAPKRLSIPLGPLYDSIQRLAEEEGLGLKLYLESAKYNGGIAPPDYVLKFATYRGKNRTSEQSVHTLMRLSPQLDSLTDVKEINSISNFKNVFYVLYKNLISTHYIPGLPIPIGFDRRSIVVDAPDIFLEDAHIPPFREQVARNTIANHVYIQAVDGQISQQTGYTFGKDYYLGDIIELEGFTGLLSKARVTEYIRSEDQFGEKAYPTLAVLDPLFVGYMPDLEPSEFDPGFDEDPDFDFDFDFQDENDLNDPETSTSSDPHDPRDPPEHNPDPTYNFGDSGDGDGDGDGEQWDAMGGQLELHPDNEHVGTGLAWYQHHERIYLEGSVYYGVTGDPDGLITIEGGVPEEARPAADTPILLYPDAPDSDSLYGDFTTFPGTVSADGTIRLSPAPLPSDSRVELYLLLGNLSWPINPPPAVSTPDTVAMEPMDQWLIQNLPSNDPPGIQPAATSQGAVIGAHGIRTHLDGEVTLVAPVFGNLAQQLPINYRSPRNDTVPVHSTTAGKWWPGFIDKHGALTLRHQRSKPLIRALNYSEWLHGEPWDHQALVDSSLSYSHLPINVWLGSAPEGAIRLEGRWTPPQSNIIGTEFGFIIGYGVSELDYGFFWYKVAAEKMETGEWAMMLTIFYSVIGTPDEQDDVLGYTRMPLGRLDNPFSPGEINQPVLMNVSIEPLGPGKIQISTIISGTRYMFEWPQHDDLHPYVWPSEIAGNMKWGSIYTLSPTETADPVSDLYNLTGDWFIPSGSTDTPPTWLPNNGYVDLGDRFKLNKLGWRRDV